jgi:hypothetical protein
MSEVVKIVQLLKSDAIEKQIAAAIVLGELKAKGPGVVEGPFLHLRLWCRAAE